jgi:hypothetical protein
VGLGAFVLCTAEKAPESSEDQGRPGNSKEASAGHRHLLIIQVVLLGMDMKDLFAVVRGS